MKMSLVQVAEWFKIWATQMVKQSLRECAPKGLLRWTHHPKKVHAFRTSVKVNLEVRSRREVANGNFLFELSAPAKCSGKRIDWINQADAETSDHKQIGECFKSAPQIENSFWSLKCSFEQSEFAGYVWQINFNEMQSARIRPGSQLN